MPYKCSGTKLVTNKTYFPTNMVKNAHKSHLYRETVPLYKWFLRFVHSKHSTWILGLILLICKKGKGNCFHPERITKAPKKSIAQEIKRVTIWDFIIKKDQSSDIVSTQQGVEGLTDQSRYVHNSPLTFVGLIAENQAQLT